MKKFTLSSLVALVLAPALPLSAATILTETFTSSTAVIIPDDDSSGVVQSIMPSTGIAILDHVSVTLTTTGGWNGDLFAYLWHNGTLTTLVNRPGKSVAAPDGSSTSGLTVTLDDAGPADIHSVPVSGVGAVTGTWQPDGRNVDPAMALDTSPRGQALADFIGQPAAGEWRLFIADVATGEQATLTSWSVTLTGPDVVPEPSSSILLASAGLLAIGRRRRKA
jgi:hypothetical protein